jgi:RHS repeat-associated protein
MPVCRDDHKTLSRHTTNAFILKIASLLRSLHKPIAIPKQIPIFGQLISSQTYHKNSYRNSHLSHPTFGMLMPERSYTATTKGYRFGFNGKEQDNEVNGEGNAYDFGARMYDSRLGRWMSVDAMKKPYFSSYQYGADNPMIYIDPDGNTEYYFNGKWIGSDGVNNNKIALVKSNKVKRGIKKGTYQYPDPKGITNGADNDEIFVIDKNVLQGAVDVLDKALKNGQDREFGLTLNKDEAGNFERTENGIVEGPVRPLDEEESGEVDQEKGDVIIHSHRTGLGKNGEHAIPEDPSPSDKSNMDEVEMSIIVGKGENGGKVGFDENDNIVDRRPSSGSINIFNKDNKDSPTRAIGGNQARNILNDHKKR